MKCENCREPEGSRPRGSAWHRPEHDQPDGVPRTGLDSGASRVRLPGIVAPRGGSPDGVLSSQRFTRVTVERRLDAPRNVVVLQDGYVDTSNPNRLLTVRTEIDATSAVWQAIAKNPNGLEWPPWMEGPPPGPPRLAPCPLGGFPEADDAGVMCCPEDMGFISIYVVMPEVPMAVEAAERAADAARDGDSIADQIGAMLSAVGGAETGHVSIGVQDSQPGVPPTPGGTGIGWGFYPGASDFGTDPTNPGHLGDVQPETPWPPKPGPKNDVFVKHWRACPGTMANLYMNIHTAMMDTLVYNALAGAANGHTFACGSFAVAMAQNAGLDVPGPAGAGNLPVSPEGLARGSGFTQVF